MVSYSPVVARWLALVAGLFLQACGGNTYSFGIWSGAFKDRMGYSQQLLDGLGTAKDIGDNVAIIAGTLYDYLPIWALLVTGAVQNILGYGGLWLAASGRVDKPPFWLACVLICVGTNGATFFQTAAVVTLVRNFPSHRGAVVGLTKGFVGLSGAIFTQIYYAVYAPNQTSFLFLITVVPPIMALLCWNVIRPIVPTDSDDEQEREHANFLITYPLGFALAVFLLSTIVSRELFRISHPVEVLFTAGMVLILASLLVVPLKEFWRERGGARQARDDVEAHAEPEGESVRLLGEDTAGPSFDSELRLRRMHSHDDANNWLDVENRAESIAYGLMTEAADSRAHHDLPRGSHEGLPVVHSAVDRDIDRWNNRRTISEEEESLISDEGAGQLEGGCYQMPRIGMDHGVLESFATLDFWVLFLSTMCGAGSGLAAINNLAQVGTSMGQGKSVGAFVSLISIWSFLGRLAAGLVSEHYVRTYGTPRPLFSLITQAIMGGGHLLFASALPGSLYVGSLIVGLCYGAQWTLMPAIASELFGLAHFGAIMAWQSVANPSGSYILSVLVAGYLYDKEADRQRGGGHVPPALNPPETGITSFLGAGNALGPDGEMRVERQVLESVCGGSSCEGGSSWLRRFSGGSWLEWLLGGSVGGSSASKTCMGARCFRLSFIIMAGVCLFGVCLNVWLTIRTREYYRGVWKEHLEKVASRESEKGSEAGDVDSALDRKNADDAHGNAKASRRDPEALDVSR